MADVNDVPGYTRFERINCTDDLLLRGLSVNQSVSNSTSFLYIKGDESTDDSLRFATRIIGVNVKAKIERRKNGVWNTGEMEFGEDSIFLGTNVSLSTVGASLKINSIDGTVGAIPLDIPFSDAGTKEPRALRAQTRVNRVVVQPVFTTEVVSTQFLRGVTTTFQGFIHAVYLKVGDAAALDEVTVRVFSGSTTSGNLIHEHLYAASVFAANTEVVLTDNIDLGTFVGDEVLLEVSSPVAFGLLGNASSVFWLAVDFQSYQYEEIISAVEGTSKFLIDNIGQVIADIVGNVMLNTTRIID